MTTLLLIISAIAIVIFYSQYCCCYFIAAILFFLSLPLPSAFLLAPRSAAAGSCRLCRGAERGPGKDEGEGAEAPECYLGFGVWGLGFRV